MREGGALAGVGDGGAARVSERTPAPPRDSHDELGSMI